MNDNNGETAAPHISPFEAIRKENEEGGEYWTARDLAGVLEYDNYRNFLKVIAKARIACENSGQANLDHFVDIDEMVQIGSGAKRKIGNVYLSRYACYLIIQNADPSKEIVALGQAYFAIQTRRQEQTDELVGLTEDQRRLYLRGQLSDHNRQLAEAANQAGVIKAIDFAIFQDHGYMGLYGGFKSRDIHIRKELKKNQHILDHMGSEELAANLFRATQTEAKLKREKIQGKELANDTHHQVGKEVRDTIKRLGGTMPEDLPTPEESIQQLQTKKQRRLKQGPQLSMFDEQEEREK
jgi:DNA-damage-inducible protein D